MTKTNLSLESIYDELKSVRINTLDAFLDNVVAILILDTFQDMTIKLTHNFYLVLPGDGF